jgi:hypothetical protein
MESVESGTNNMVICKLIVMKHKNCFVVYWSDVTVPGRKLPSWWSSEDDIADGERGNLWKKKMILCCFALLCMPSCTSLNGAMIACISFLNCRHLSMKWLAWSRW